MSKCSCGHFLSPWELTCRDCGRKPYETSTHQHVRLFWTEADAYRYSIHNGTGKPVEPRGSWQREEYARVMGRETPDLSLPQFDYSPRTKAGKALLEELTDNDS